MEEGNEAEGMEIVDGAVINGATSWSLTHVSVLNVRFVWTISHFSHLMGFDSGYKLESSHFTLSDGMTWCLRCYPSGLSTESRHFISVYLVLVSSKDPKPLVKVKFALLNKKREPECEMESKGVLKFSEGVDFGFWKFIRKSHMLNEGKHLLVDDKLSIMCHFGIVGESIHFISRPPKPKVPPTQMAEDFGALLRSGKFSDVTIICKDGQISAHKFVLASRSPAFAYLFNHITPKFIKIEMAANTFLLFLTYIYTGKINDLREADERMLGAATVFEVKNLKTTCEMSIASNLTPNRAATALKCAYRHEATRLKEETLKYITNNTSEVMASPTWQTLKKTHPKIVADTHKFLKY